MKLSKALSYRITQYLAEEGWSDYRLATRAGVPTSTMSNVINCKVKSCKVDTLYNICRGLNITIAEFFDNKLFIPENIDDND